MATATLTKRIRFLLFELKRDPKAREAMRPFALAVILFFSIIYSMNILLISPAKKTVHSLMSRKSRLEQVVRDREVILDTVFQLEREYSVLKDKFKRVRFKRKILLLERSKATDDDTFRRILLGLGPGSPKMRSLGLVKIVRETTGPSSLVTLEGEGSYRDLLEYLGYLQRRLEIGYLDKLNITEGFCTEGRRQRRGQYPTDRICFRLVAGKEYNPKLEGRE